MEEKNGVQKTWNLPPQNFNFAGREELLEDIEKGLRIEDSTHFPVIVTTLHGLGGIGKTSLVTQFAHKILKEHPQRYQHILWIRSDTPESLQTNYFTLAKELGLQGEKPEDILKAVKQWLESNPLNLVIYDDIPNFDAIRTYMPERGCHILMTSRYTKWPRQSINIKVDCFTEKECRDYIQTMLGQRGEDTLEDVDALGKVVGGLPLALAQACGYLTQVNEISIREYLKLYEANKETRIQFLSNRTFPVGNDGDHDPVATTFKLSIEIIQLKSPLAAKLLTLCAFLHLQKIPDFLLKEIGKQNDFNPEQQKDVSETLTLLGNFSLISRDLELQTCNIHVLIQEVIRLNLSEAETTRYVDWVYEALAKLFREINYAKNSEHQKLLLPHSENFLKEVESDSERLLALIDLMDEACYNLNYTKKRKVLLEHAIKAQEKFLVPKDLAHQKRIMRLGSVYRFLGELVESYKLFETNLPIFEKYAGPLDRAKALNNWGSTCFYLGKSKKCKELYEKALEIHQGISYQGKDPKENPIIPMWVCLGSFYAALGDADKGVKLLEDALSLQGGDDDKGADLLKATTLDNLGVLYCGLDKVKEKSIPYLNRARSIKEKPSDSQNGREKGITLENLGIAEFILGDILESEKLLTQSLGFLKEHYGKERYSSYLCIARIFLGNICCALGRVEEGAGLIKRAVQIEKDFHKSIPEAFDFILTSFGILINMIGNIGVRKKLLEHCLPVYQNCYGGEHEYTKEIVKKLEEIKINHAISEVNDRDLSFKTAAEKSSQGNQFQINNNNNAEVSSTLGSSAIYGEDVESKSTYLNKIQRVGENDMEESAGTREVIPSNSLALLQSGSVLSLRDLPGFYTVSQQLLFDFVQREGILVPSQEHIVNETEKEKFKQMCSSIISHKDNQEAWDTKLLSVTDRIQNNPIHYMCFAGNLAALEWVFSHKLYSEEANQYGFQPLHVAALMGYLGLVKKLGRERGLTGKHNKAVQIRCGNQVISVDALGFAVIMGRVEVVTFLLEELKRNLGASNYGNLFHLAILGQQYEMLDVLLHTPWFLKRFINNTDADGLTPLCLAVQLGDEEAIVRIGEVSLTRLELGIIDFPHPATNKTALFFGVEYPNKPILELLLGRYDANPELKAKGLLSEEKAVSAKKFAEQMAGQQLQSNQGKKDDKWRGRQEVFVYLQNWKEEERVNRDRLPILQEVQTRRIKNLVFQGGGPKGWVYLGVQRYLERNDLMKEVARVAGTSAGAITACAFAMGFNVDETQRLMQAMDMLSFVEGVDLTRFKAFMNEDSGRVGKLKHGFLSFGEAVKAAIKKGNISLISLSLQALAMPLQTVEKVMKETMKLTGLASGKVFLDWVEREVFFKKSGVHHLTFKELRELIKAKGKPYRHLYVLTTDLNTKSVICMNSEEETNGRSEWDNVVISSAIRASMSIPGVFEPCHLWRKIELGDGETRLEEWDKYFCMDGGILKNYPVDIFDRLKFTHPEDVFGDKEFPRFNKQTLGFTIKAGDVEEGRLDELAESPKKLIQAVLSMYFDAEAILAQLSGITRGRTVEIDSCGVGLLDFDATVAQREAMVASGEKACEEKLKIKTPPSKKAISAVTSLLERTSPIAPRKPPGNGGSVANDNTAYNSGSSSAKNLREQNALLEVEIERLQKELKEKYGIDYIFRKG